MKIEVTFSGEQCRTFELEGRLGWTMAQLANAGAKGVTPNDQPAPRWSSYVHQLRQRGIQIDTKIKSHEGTYAGHHPRYRLACDAEVTILEPETRV